MTGPHSDASSRAQPAFPQHPAEQRFFDIEAASGALLLLAAAVALLWANCDLAHRYFGLWAVAIGPPGGRFTQDLHFWINDGLMALFFLAVGLEIRRELREGALASLKAAALPLAAALGGICVPALLFLAVNQDSELARGWAIPTATDIAFAVGVLALLGRRVPVALRILLLAIAIVDDIAAVVAIGIFYSGKTSAAGLAVAAAGALLALLLRRARLRSFLWYSLPGILMWVGLLEAGVHPALAGFALGMLMPAAASTHRGNHGAPDLETKLHPWVAYGVMPLFALANAGVALGDVAMHGSALALTQGIVLGLVLGKPCGIVAASLLAVRLGWCALPHGVNLRGLVTVGCLGGIGFTMSIFIAGLAFPAQDLLDASRLAVLAASAIAATAGLTAGWVLLKRPA